MSNTNDHNYQYPVGDFLSGFSDDDKNPCEYEIECQRMVIRGVQFFDNNPELHEWITKNQPDVFHAKLKPIIDHMCQNPDLKEGEEAFGQTGAMVGQTVKHAYQAKKMGWDEYIKTLTTDEGESDD